MEREILFRAKRLDNQEWVYGFIYHHQSPITNALGIDVWRITEKGTNATTFNVYQKTICQYTGLKDKNGNEIYEGDIVESVFEPIRPTENHLIILGVVEWWNERAEFIVNCNNLDGFDLSTTQNISGYKYADGRFKMTFATKGKVVGNIHDNPELMKGVRYETC